MCLYTMTYFSVHH